jgi:putative transposase
VLACYRYIELNPVRAGMVRHPREYRWSSYGANALGRADPLLTPQEQYVRLGRREEMRCEAYRDLFKAQLDAEAVAQIRGATNGNVALGSERFKKRVEAALGRGARRAVAGRPRGQAPDDGPELEFA